METKANLGERERCIYIYVYVCTGMRGRGKTERGERRREKERQGETKEREVERRREKKRGNSAKFVWRFYEFSGNSMRILGRFRDNDGFSRKVWDRAGKQILGDLGSQEAFAQIATEIGRNRFSPEAGSRTGTAGAVPPTRNQSHTFLFNYAETPKTLRHLQPMYKYKAAASLSAYVFAFLKGQNSNFWSF